MNQTCCKDCLKRYLGCHDSCEDYKKFKEKRLIANKKEREFKGNSAGWDSYNKHNKRGEM